MTTKFCFTSHVPTRKGKLTQWETPCRVYCSSTKPRSVMRDGEVIRRHGQAIAEVTEFATSCRGLRYSDVFLKTNVRKKQRYHWRPHFQKAWMVHTCLHAWHLESIEWKRTLRLVGARRRLPSEPQQGWRVLLLVKTMWSFEYFKSAGSIGLWSVGSVMKCNHACGRNCRLVHMFQLP
jgi:hypothetical protein